MLILVTGFAPFAGAGTNPSWDAVCALEGTVPEVARTDPAPTWPQADSAPTATLGPLTLVRRRLPVSYARAARGIEDLIDTLRPDAVVLTGLAARSPGVRVEATARAVRPVGADEDGVTPAPPVGAGEDLHTPLDVGDLVRAAAGAPVGVAASGDAGSYVCNSTYLAALAASRGLEGEGLAAPAVVFVHVPATSTADTGAVAAALSLLLGEVAAQVRRGLGPASGLSVRGGARARLLRPVPPTPGRALRIAVTGGIGTGKSTVAAQFAPLGAVVVDADTVAREVVAPGTEALAEITRVFGTRVIGADGALDRGAMARLVFADPAARARLEAITLPRIAARSADLLRATPPGGLGVYDIPLLVEAGARDRADVVVTVDAPPDLRLPRLAARGVAVDQALARMATQAGTEERRRLTTVWVDNDGTAEDLAPLVRDIVGAWLAPGHTGDGAPT